MVSLCCRDPDGTAIALQVDAFAAKEESRHGTGRKARFAAGTGNVHRR
jgi:hypothetical protein